MTDDKVKVGLVELPELLLFDTEGNQWCSYRPDVTLISKQVLMSQLAAVGYDVQLFNLRRGAYREEVGQVLWKDTTLIKSYAGGKIDDIDPTACDVWGITSNFTQQQEVADLVIKHLVGGGALVVVGGSDAIANPDHYLQLGVTAVVTDKLGTNNSAIIDYVVGRDPKAKLHGVIIADGFKAQSYPANGQQANERQTKPRARARGPEEWPLPDVGIARQCLGTEYWTSPFPEELLPIGSIVADVGCDRKCDFCQTPRYRIGYNSMSPDTLLRWAEVQKEAGAKSIIFGSDQFLARLLWSGGREEVLEIMAGLRAMELVVLWPNGLEIRKATIGRGFNRSDTDLTPDEELVEALWGWNGKVGTYYALIPAERPIIGQENYAKLLPWQEHCEMMRAIVRTGLPNLSYGGVIGFADESNESLSRLEEALNELYADLKSINPALSFQVAFNNLFPIPGTPQMDTVLQSGLLNVKDPAVFGSAYSPSCDTHHLSYGDIADWLTRILQIGDTPGETYGVKPELAGTM